MYTRSTFSLQAFRISHATLHVLEATYAPISLRHWNHWMATGLENCSLEGHAAVALLLISDPLFDPCYARSTDLAFSEALCQLPVHPYAFALC
jgi:hypothetical protein